MVEDIEDAFRELTKVVLVGDTSDQQKIRELIKKKFGYGSLAEMVKVTAKEKNISEDEAKQRIVNSPMLMRLAFIIA